MHRRTGSPGGSGVRDLYGATGALEQAREAYARRDWAAAYELLTAAAQEEPLRPEDVFRLAVAAHVAGNEPESREALARGHREALRDGDRGLAVRMAFWLATRLSFAGDVSQSNGWYARCRRLLESLGDDCAERGYTLVHAAMDRLEQGDFEGACAMFRESRALGIKFADADLEAIAGHGLGRALIRCGRYEEAMATLDEVMVAVAGGEVSPMAAGDVYCGVMEACHETSDVARAREWTAALTRWCESQSEQFPYRSQCLVFRAEVLQLQGAWEAAIIEVTPACEQTAPAVIAEVAGSAFYRLAELHRLRGEFDKAEQAYRTASRLGATPEPGLALLWLAKGQVKVAANAMRRALSERQESFSRARMLDAYVEVMLAADDVPAAIAASEELAAAAQEFQSSVLYAAAKRASGAVLLARGRAAEALHPLREAFFDWQQLEAPYEAARTRVLLARACEELGDGDSAAVELDAARWAFEQLGAAADLERLEARTAAAVPQVPGGLTRRELEVVRLVASGSSNREIARTLVISEHTVARHLQNIFAKLRVSSRTALSAYAFEHELV